MTWLSRIFGRRRQPAIERAEVLRLLRAEFLYWMDQEAADDDAEQIRMGAMGSVSNVMAAVMGRPAKGHLKTFKRDAEKTAGEPAER